jgi:transcriptional regulator with XRE-family HTH domain
MTLQQRCAARGLTLEQLAERSGVLLATVLKIDAGTVRLQPITRRRLAAVLDLDPDTLRDALSAARRRQVIPPAPGSQLR